MINKLVSPAVLQWFNFSVNFNMDVIEAIEYVLGDALQKRCGFTI